MPAISEAHVLHPTPQSSLGFHCSWFLKQEAHLDPKHCTSTYSFTQPQLKFNCNCSRGHDLATISGFQIHMRFMCGFAKVAVESCAYFSESEQLQFLRLSSPAVSRFGTMDAPIWDKMVVVVHAGILFFSPHHVLQTIIARVLSVRAEKAGGLSQ